MPRAKPKWGWQGMGFPMVGEDGKPFVLKKSVKDRIAKFVPKPDEVAAVLAALEQACRQYLLFRRDSKTQSRSGEVRVAIKEAAQFAKENGRVPPHLDENTEDAIIDLVQHEVLFRRRQGPEKNRPLTAVERQYIDPGFCIAEFAMDNKLRDVVLKEFLSQYDENNEGAGGRPFDFSKRAFAEIVGQILSANGISVGKGHPHRYDRGERTSTDVGGPYYQILDALFIELGEPQRDLRWLLDFAPKQAKSANRRKFRNSLRG